MFAELALLAAGAVSGPALAAACAGKDGWEDPAPPARLAPGTWYVGTCGVSAVLVTSPAGHVLIDGITEKAAPLIAANIARLGFRPRDVRLLLNSHEHLDHAGGFAALKRITGAPLAVQTAARGAVEAGRDAADDPQKGFGSTFPAARVDRAVRDGEVVRLGPVALTAHATPGHAPGSTSWTWNGCEERRCVRVAYADSLSALAAPGYRFGDHPAYLRAFRHSIDRVAALPCDLLVTPHPQASRLFERLAGTEPARPGACARYAAAARARLDATLAGERR